MASYPNLDAEPVDPLILASENAVRALRDAKPLIALPPRRVDLEAAARSLEDALKERSGT